MRLSDYIANFFVENGLCQNFSVVGGGAMHLNDALGHTKGLSTIYVHHEQTAAMAAESYARIYNKPGIVCVTSGPGGINALNGVAGAYTDSIPMIVLSGQVRYDNTVEESGLPLRCKGDQEFRIIDSVKSMTKYAKMISNPNDIYEDLEKCLYLSQTGRPGPVWLDIPVNVQGAEIEDISKEKKEEIRKKVRAEIDAINRSSKYNNILADKSKLKQIARDVITKIKNSKRPVFYTGNGIRIAGAMDIFNRVSKILDIPLVVSWNGIDVVETENKNFCGRPGGRGDRCGNLTVQNSDLIFSVGSRLSIRQVGYNSSTWARDAYKIMCDIDGAELDKKNIRIDQKICADCYDLLYAMEEVLTKEKNIYNTENHKEWKKKIEEYKKYFAMNENIASLDKKLKKANIYAAMHYISTNASKNQVTVVGNGSPCVVGAQIYEIKKGSRFISQSGMASMGYDLPAAIGAYLSLNKDKNKNKKIKDNIYKGLNEVYPNYKKDLICITGDGSIQMNIQELQTIVHHKMDIKIFLINNGGYHSIRQTQHSFFSKHCLVGIGADSITDGKCDLSFPDMKKLSNAYGIKYTCIKSNKDTEKVIKSVLSKKGPIICEIFTDTKQAFSPRQTSKKLKSGDIVSLPLEEMSPELDSKTLDELMIVKRVKFE